MSMWQGEEEEMIGEHHREQNRGGEESVKGEVRRASRWLGPRTVPEPPGMAPAEAVTKATPESGPGEPLPPLPGCPMMRCISAALMAFSPMA